MSDFILSFRAIRDGLPGFFKPKKMDRDKAIQILNSTGAGKADLRQALSFALGVKPIGNGKEKTVFTECKGIFLDAYRAHTNAGYYFAAKDAGALKQIVVKIEHLNDSAEADLTKATFGALMKNLPKWYRDSAFSLAVINSKFNEIIAEIRKHGKEEKGVSDDYLQRKLDLINTKC
jgi:hypothetical protein